MPGLTSFDGLNVLVTGASSGIGRLLALRMAAAGGRLALVARRNRELEAVAEKIRAGGGEAVAMVCDVGDREQALATADRAVDAVGPIDVLVNNAGFGHHRRFLDWDLEDMERVMRVNFLGSLYFTKALLPAMVERGRGWLVFIASAAGRIAPADETVYAASKHAMIGLAGSLSLEVEEAGVHVLTVCPGAIRTPFFDDEALARRLRGDLDVIVACALRKEPSRRYGTAEQLAADLRELQIRAGESLVADGIPVDDHEITYQADLRYAGQAFQITVDFTEAELADLGIHLPNNVDG